MHWNWLILAACASAAADLQHSAHEMKIQLEEKILPYWFDTAQDTLRGGYLLNDDEVRGRRTPLEKQIVTQSRLIWGFSHAHLGGFSTERRNYLQAARQGYQFLLAHFLDEQNGGYFWSTNLKGKPMNSCKFLYGEAFVIYAFAEYYRASGDVDALSHALALYRDIQTHFHDEKNGGWFEQADRNWKLLPSGDPRHQLQGSASKSANTHLHWMEALTELYDVSRDPAVRESLIEALQLNQRYFWPALPARHATHFHFDWKPMEIDGLSYGHNVEFGWLMIRAERVLGLQPSWDRFYALLDHALLYGYDHARGGLYRHGFGDQPADDTEKIWWAQAEMLAALTEALEHQSDPLYESVLESLLHFINTYQASPKDGIWLSSVAADGRPQNTSKANSWKGNYHDVRALQKFIDHLRLLGR